VLVAGMISLVQTDFVGRGTIYQARFEPLRAAAHGYILNNEAPPGGWASAGGNGTNLRIGVVYLAEGIVKATGADGYHVYLAIDLVGLFFALLALYGFLSRWFEPETCLLAVLYLGCVLPMTYAFHYFHPWDRVSLLLWISVIWAIAADRVWVAAAFLSVAVVVKYDALALPGLYLFAHATRRNLPETLAKTGVLTACALAVFALLLHFIPGGFEPKDHTRQVVSNLGDLISHFPSHPPLLAFGLPLALAAFGAKSAGRFAKGAALFGVLMLVPHFVLTEFVEVRAQLGIFVLLCPAALYGLHRLTSPFSGPMPASS